MRHRRCGHGPPIRRGQPVQVRTAIKLHLPLVVALTSVTPHAMAQTPSSEATSPSRPVRIIVPFFPGGAPEQLHEYLKTDLAKYGKPVKAVGIKPGA
jgi:tripartite-type tricarboxylate transporter receptor subunit TctC